MVAENKRSNNDELERKVDSIADRTAASASAPAAEGGVAVISAVRETSIDTSHVIVMDG
jgi:hypothetical protein